MNISRTNTSQHCGTISENIIVRLNQMMERGEIRPGGRLPAERDLARLLGVSHPTLRIGIRSLTAVGILRSRRGVGTFVVESNLFPALDTTPLRLLAALHGFTSDEMFEARVSLEMDVAALAAEHAANEHLTQLAEEIAGMFASLDAPEQFLIHDLKFHQTIAKASGNRILTALMNMLTEILFEERHKTVSRAADLKEAAESHRQIYQALREKNAAAAALAMREHLIATQKAQQREMLAAALPADQ